MRISKICYKVVWSFILSAFSAGLLISTAIAQTALPTTIKSHLTATQAIGLARQFCQTIGQPVTLPATTVFPSPEEFPDQPNHFWQNCWKISFGDAVEVKVIDDTGVIRGYENIAFYHKPPSERNQPVGEFITEQAAMQKALLILKATGQTEELTPPKIRFEEIGRPVKHLSTDWSIWWQRSSHGIAYREDEMAVMLEGESGEVISAGMGYYSPPAHAFTKHVNAADAEELASKVITAVGIPDAVPVTTLMRGGPERMERPNTFWQNGDENHPLPGPARPVQVSVFLSDGIYYEVWVDMENGHLIGGSYYSIGSGRLRIKHYLPISTLGTKKVD